jgi:hypothetical protein
VDDALLARLSGTLDEQALPSLAQQLAAVFTRCWSPPRQADLETLNQASQYGAWVLLHGNRVNHFTALINSQAVPALDDIDKTVAALRDRGVPMKDEVEGARGSKLRQTATAAAAIAVEVCGSDGETRQTAWNYAYFELAERGYVQNNEGQKMRFEGFLGPQASQLFDMTRGD